MDKIRVLRIIEYTGDRAAVESVVSRSIYGTRTFGIPGDLVEIRGATIGTYPEILEAPNPEILEAPNETK